MARPNRHAIVVSSVTFNALQSLSKYRETMDDVVLKAVIVYADSLKINSEAIAYAISEAKSRFLEGGER